MQAIHDKRRQESEAKYQEDRRKYDNGHAGRRLSERDRDVMIDMLLEEGRTMEEAMRFLADEGMTWEDMTVSMLENFLAEGGS